MPTPHELASIDQEMTLVNASDTAALFQEGDDESSTHTLNIGVWEDAGNPESLSITVTFPDSTE